MSTYAEDRAAEKAEQQHDQAERAGVAVLTDYGPLFKSHERIAREQAEAEARLAWFNRALRQPYVSLEVRCGPWSSWTTHHTLRAAVEWLADEWGEAEDIEATFSYHPPLVSD